jgi:uncharacterized protein YjeT (DUF2065 family)
LTTTLIMAFGLMLVLEGVLPLVAPQVWRDAFRRMTEMDDGQLRFAGLLSMVIGLLIVLVVK